MPSEAGWLGKVPDCQPHLSTEVVGQTGHDQDKCSETWDIKSPEQRNSISCAFETLGTLTAWGGPSCALPCGPRPCGPHTVDQWLTSRTLTDPAQPGREPGHWLTRSPSCASSGTGWGATGLLEPRDGIPQKQSFHPQLVLRQGLWKCYPRGTQEHHFHQHSFFTGMKHNFLCSEFLKKVSPLEAHAVLIVSAKF